MRCLSFCQRRQLLELTASSGSLPNLELAARSAGLAMTYHIAAAAARAGQLHVCKWLQEHNVCASHWSTLVAAAGAGQQQVCDWLLAIRTPITSAAAARAAEAGHAGLMDRLLSLNPLPPRGLAMLLASACEGCDLPTLQHKFTDFGVILEGAGPAGNDHEDDGGVVLGRWDQARLVSAAACSPTPDWRAKLEWLKLQGCRPADAALQIVVRRCPDALERLRWLQSDHGVPLASSGAAAAEYGKLDALRLLLAEGAEVDRHTTGAAVRGGQLAALQALRDAGCPMGAPTLVELGARSGKPEVVVWLLETLGGEAAAAAELLTAEVFRAAAGVSPANLELLAWLRERGCPWDAAAFAAAARAGCEEALEWLVDRGCPMGDDGRPYVAAGCNCDMAILRCLRRLGCAWGRPGYVVKRCLQRWVGACSSVAHCLMELGCPLSLAEAMEVAAAGFCSQEEARAWAS